MDKKKNEDTGSALYVLVGLCCVFLIRYLTLFGALALGTAICAGIYWIRARIRENRRITKIRNQPRNLYFIGCHPDTGAEPDVMGDWARHLDFIPHQHVAAAAAAMKKDLERYGNCNGLDAKGNRVPVRVLRFIMGEHGFESWAEYCLRVEAGIKADTEKQTNTEYGISADHALTHLLNQDKGTGSWEWNGTYKPPVSKPKPVPATSKPEHDIS